MYKLHSLGIVLTMESPGKVCVNTCLCVSIVLALLLHCYFETWEASHNAVHQCNVLNDTSHFPSF